MEGVVQHSRKIYLDYNATTPMAPSVIGETANALSTLWGNPSSKYEQGLIAKEAIARSRENIRQMLNGNSSDEVVFMSGGTEANNHVIWNCVKHFRKSCSTKEAFSHSKPHIITSKIEHDSIRCYLEMLEVEGEINLTYLGVSGDGQVDVDEVVKAIRKETILVTIMLANNETGSLQPIKNISDKLKSVNASRSLEYPTVYLHTDAAQAIGKIKVDVQELAVDYLTVVGHKFYAPRIGALWVRSGCPFYPMFYGGGQEKSKRPGTENTCMIVGLGEAARLVCENLPNYTYHFTEIIDHLKHLLSCTFDDQVVFNTPPPQMSLPNTLNVSLLYPNLLGADILGNCSVLEASVGAACHSHKMNKPSQILLEHGVPYDVAQSAVRLSVGRDTTKEDIELVVADIKESVEKCLALVSKI